MMKFRVAGAGLLLLLTGCIGQMVEILPDEVTSEDIVTVKLHIEADQAATVRYSDGVTTTVAGMALEGNGDAGTMDVSFPAQRPFLAVATVVTAKPGKLTCTMEATGVLDGDDEDSGAPRIGSLGGTGSTVNHRTFAMCRTSETQMASNAIGGHAVELRTKASGKSDWHGWVSGFSVAEDRAQGSSSLAGDQVDGPVRLVVVATERGDIVSCRILIDGDVEASAKTAGYGDIANCTAIVK